jgi:uncharacterized protein YndB with AHSA1/START domain
MPAAVGKPAAQHELVITRVFDAPRALVFQAWTDPRHINRWFGPKDFPAAEVEIDVKRGGKWRARLKSVGSDPDLTLGGVYREIVPPERLVFTFAWDEEGVRGIETTVTITFEDQGSKTRMTLRQIPFQSADERDGHNYGWSSAFDRLDEFLARN